MAPITVGEKVAVSPDKLGDALSLLRSYIPYGVILSTGNRTEIYAIDSEDCNAEQASLGFIKAWADIQDDSLLHHVYCHQGKEAAEHLLRIASGLESMVAGEFEILGQVKQALENAEKAGMVNLPLRRAFHSALQTGRRVRSQTQLSEEIIADEVDKFVSWWQALEVTPVVSALMSNAEEIRSAQLNKTLKKLPPLSTEQRQYLEAMTRSIVNRLLEDPIQYLKLNGNDSDCEMVKELFQLNTKRHS